MSDTPPKSLPPLSELLDDTGILSDETLPPLAIDGDVGDGDVTPLPMADFLDNFAPEALDAPMADDHPSALLSPTLFADEMLDFDDVPSLVGDADAPVELGDEMPGFDTDDSWLDDADAATTALDWREVDIAIDDAETAPILDGEDAGDEGPVLDGIVSLDEGNTDGEDDAEDEDAPEDIARFMALLDLPIDDEETPQ
ncbi:MAG: hypothetical protein GX146_10420 [Myxococcales bacterium]|jgi:hypothetical protein|nr:hypothetical protein [Myxococcales bacterium]